MLSQVITRSYVEHPNLAVLVATVYRIRTFGSDKGDSLNQLFEYKQLSTMEYGFVLIAYWASRLSNSRKVLWKF